ncbi:MAG: DUF3810 family protein, partial [Chitinophagaceae bacterium]
MKPGKKAIFAAIVLLLCLIIKLYSSSHSRVEAGYATLFFPKFAGVLRFLLGWIPISVGDIIYGIAIILLLWKLIRLLKFAAKRQSRSEYWRRLQNLTVGTVLTLALLYFIFNLFWGINYNRKGIAFQLGLPSQ